MDIKQPPKRKRSLFREINEGFNALVGMRPRKDRGQCSYCYGNDGDIPCAHPSEGKPGCLRDARLAVELPRKT
jgi:hypothetical protein